MQLKSAFPTAKIIPKEEEEEHTHKSQQKNIYIYIFINSIHSLFKGHLFPINQR